MTGLFSPFCGDPSSFVVGTCRGLIAEAADEGRGAVSLSLYKGAMETIQLLQNLGVANIPNISWLHAQRAIIGLNTFL